MPESSVAQNRQRDRLFGGREVCERCRRPKKACYCEHVTPVDTQTRLVLLQHPRERHVAIGTAHMASLCLTNSELLVGVDWERSEALARALAVPERPPILLYPGRGAIDIMRSPPPGPVTLVVVDGTWSQTKKVVRTNPTLAALPRYAFTPPRPSEYRIRKEPDDASVATIEALVHALTALEGDAARFSTLLAPFRKMIDYQLSCEARLRGARQRHAKRRARVRQMRVPRVLTNRLEDVVCVAAEANAWPFATRAARPELRDELVQWAAHRPSTGEALSVVVAPRGELAPGTVLHTRLGEATLFAGGTLEELHARWRGFVRDSDVICSWGRYEVTLFTASGGWLPPAHLDLRRVARDVTRGAAGALAQRRCDHGSRASHLAGVPGRAGEKLRALDAVISSFIALHAEAATAER